LAVFFLLSSWALSFWSFGSISGIGNLSVSPATEAASVAYKRHRKRRKHTRTHYCPCGVEAERPYIRYYDDSSTVLVSVEIDEHGNVTKAVALTGRRGLQERAEADVLKMKFEPVKADGSRIEQARILTLDYTEKDQ